MFPPTRLQDIFSAARSPPVNVPPPNASEHVVRRPSPAGDGANDEKRFCAGGDCVRQRGIRRLEGIVLGTGEEAQEGTTLSRDVIAYGASQHRILCLEGVKHRALRNRTFDMELNLRSGVRQRSKMSR